MSTRALIKIYGDTSDAPIATIYKHFDGYPRALGDDLGFILTHRIYAEDDASKTATVVSQYLLTRHSDSRIVESTYDDYAFLYSIYPAEHTVCIEGPEFTDGVRITLNYSQLSTYAKNYNK